MKTEIKQVSPKMATELLKQNKGNRKMDDRLVRELLNYIINDQWKLTHQGVCISQTGNLLDGQHRLAAISKSNKTVPIMITTGLPDNIMTVIDIGKRRTVGDSFQLLEIKDSNSIAALLVRYYKLKSGHFAMKANRGGGLVSSIDQKYQFYLENEQLIRKCLELGRKCYNKLRIYKQTEIASISLFLVLDRKHSFSKVSDFWSQVHMLDGFTITPAAKVLTGVLLKYIGGSEKIKPNYKAAITMKAWNLFVNSGAVKVLKYSETEKMPAYI